MDVNWHLRDQTPNVSGGLHAGGQVGGWVNIETDRECLTVFSEDLPALAAAFAAASRRALDLARSDMAKRSEPLTRGVESAIAHGREPEAGLSHHRPCCCHEEGSGLGGYCGCSCHVESGVEVAAVMVQRE